MKKLHLEIRNFAVTLSFGLISFLGLTQNNEWPYDELQIPNYENELSHKNGAFIENLGQLGVFGQPGLQAKGVKYYSAQPDYCDFVLRDRLSFVSAHSVDSAGLLYNVNRLDLHFFDDIVEEYRTLNPTPFLEGHAKRHFYTGLTATGFENVREFNEIHFKELYTDIDMSLTHNKLGLKVFFRLQPSVDPATIKLEFNGLTGLNFSGGNVNIAAYQSNYQFNQPRAYQIDNANNINFISVSYAVDLNGRVFFDIPTYDPSLNVYITMKQGSDSVGPKDVGDNLEWSSYIGEVGTTTLYSVTTDSEGNVFYAGKTNHANFATNTGNFPLTSYSGGGDGFVFKFNENIEPQWYTFIGGNNATAANLPALDKAISISRHTNDGIIMTGISASTNLPMIGSSYDTDNSLSNTNPDCSECEDIFYARFNANGILQYSTYFGGPDAEVSMEIISKSGDVYIVGERTPSSPLITHPDPNAFNESIGSGLIIKFDNLTDVLSWSTSFNVQRINCVTKNESSDLIIGGYVNSNNSMVCETPSADPNFSSHNGGTFDGFIARFDVNDDLTHSAFYGGECREMVTDLATDQNTDITYGIGTAYSVPGQGSCVNNGTSDLPIIGAGLLRAPSWGAHDHVYFSFDGPQVGTPLNFTLSGYFSGDGGEWGTFSDWDIPWTRPTIAVLNDGAFAITGASNSGNPNVGVDKIPFPTINPQGWYSQLSNNTAGSDLAKDAYIAVFDNTGTLKYTTFFGGGRYAEGPAEIAYTNVNSVNRLYFAGNTHTINTTTMPLAERLYVEEFNIIVSTDYFRYLGPSNQNPTSQAAWGAFLTMDGLNIPGTVSLSEMDHSENLSIYPNPANNEITIESTEEIIEVKIYSADGRLVLWKEPNSNTIQIDLRSLNQGAYLIRITNPTSSNNMKIIKQ